MLIRATRYNSVWLKTKEVIGNTEKKYNIKNSCNYKITNKLIYEKQKTDFIAITNHFVVF